MTSKDYLKDCPPSSELPSVVPCKSECTGYAISIMDLMQEMLDEAPNVLWLKQGCSLFEACWMMVESREGRARLEERFPDYA